MVLVRDLLESATAVLYHSTTPDAAIEILGSGAFELSNSAKNKSELKFVPRKGWNYFLSTARTPFNVFANDLSLSDAVTFKMDGSWFNKHGYIVRPVNWVSDEFHDPDLDTAFTHKEEAEDRVFSRGRSIPIDPIIECHVLLLNSKTWKDVKMIEKICQRRGIPCWIYEDRRSWMQMNKNKQAEPSTFDIKTMKKREAAIAAEKKKALKELKDRLTKHPELLTADDVDTNSKIRLVLSINPRTLLYWPTEPDVDLINRIWSDLEMDDRLYGEMEKKYPDQMRKLIDINSKSMWD